jgi:hypothetical protein
LYEILIIKDLIYFNTSGSDKKTTKDITKDNLPLDKDLNKKYPKYKVEELTT